MLNHDITNICNEFMAKEESRVSKYLGSDLNVKAKQDFRYLCTQSNYTFRDDLYMSKIYKNSNDFGSFAAVGVSCTEPMVAFPKEMFDESKGNQFLALLTYNGDRPNDAYIIPAETFREKQKMFSIFGTDKRTACYTIKLKNKDKLAEYKFGLVFDKLTNNL